MANQALCIEYLSGTKEKVQELWNTLLELGVNKGSVWMGDIARHYGIDMAKKGLSVRGRVITAELTSDDESDYHFIMVESECAWDRTEVFDAVNLYVFDSCFKHSWMVNEPGCDVFYVHDEESHFVDCCCYVTAYGEPFDEECEDVYASLDDAINVWCQKMDYNRGEKTTEEMKEIIEEYEYEDDDTSFWIHEFVIE